MRMKSILAVLVWLVITSSAWGQITVPEQSAVGDQLIATVNASVPPGATFEGGWSIQCDAGCTASYAALKAENSIGIWAKNKGSYRIEYRGYWVLLGPKITVKDVDGNDQTFQPFLGSGLVNESANFTITGGSPPGPIPPPPSGKQTVWFAMKAEQRDNVPAYANSLAFRQKLEAAGHDYQETLFEKVINSPPARLSKVAQAVREANLPYPVVVLEPIAGGTIRVLSLPDSEGEMLEVLK
jgi:hypothetical protein